MMILTPPGAGKILLNVYQPAPRGRPASEASAADLGGELLAGNGKTSFECGAGGLPIGCYLPV